MEINTTNIECTFTKSNTITNIPLPPLNNNYNHNPNSTNSSCSHNEISPDTLSLNTDHSDTYNNKNVSPNKLNAIEQAIQNGIKQYITPNKSTSKYKTNSNEFDFKKNLKLHKNAFTRNKDKSSVKVISKSLQSLHKHMKKRNGEFNMHTNSKSVGIIKGPLNGYISYSKPMNLRFIRDRRNYRNSNKNLQPITSIKTCNVGDKVIVMNHLHREDNQITEYETHTIQIQGVINRVQSNFISVLVPINFERNDFILRKIYVCDIKNDEYGGLFKISDCGK